MVCVRKSGLDQRCGLRLVGQPGEQPCDQRPDLLQKPLAEEGAGNLDRSVLPAGEYLAAIAKSGVSDTRKGDGRKVDLVLTTFVL